MLPVGWENEESVDDWSMKIALQRGNERKAMTSMTILVS
jgi:hypothetical protein